MINIEWDFKLEFSHTNIIMFIGMILTMDRNNVPVVTIHGPPKTVIFNDCFFLYCCSIMIYIIF